MPTRSQSEAHQWLLPLLPPSKWTDTDASGGRWQQEIIFISRCHLPVESFLSWSLLIILSATANLSQQVDGYSKNITRPLSSNFFIVASALSFFRQNRNNRLQPSNCLSSQLAPRSPDSGSFNFQSRPLVRFFAIVDCFQSRPCLWVSLS